MTSRADTDVEIVLLHDLRRKKEGLIHKERGLLSSLTTVRSEIADVDRRMRQMISTVFGVDLALDDARASDVDPGARISDQNGAVALGSSVVPSADPVPPDPSAADPGACGPIDDPHVRQSSGLLDASDSPVGSAARPSAALQVFEPGAETARVVGLNGKDDPDLHLLNDRCRARWRNVQTIRAALERLGGRARMCNLIVEVMKLEAGFSFDKLRCLLHRPNGHFKNRDGLWRYRHGGPELTPLEAKAFRWMTGIKAAIEDIGGAAAFGQIMDYLQRNYSADQIDSTKLTRYLKIGPFARNRVCLWEYSPGMRGREEGRKRWDATTLEEAGYDAAALGVPALPTDPADWDGIVRTPEQAKKWITVKTVGSVIERLGNEARMVDIHRTLVAEQGAWSEGALSALLSRDIHFFRPYGMHVWAYEPGPPSLTQRQLKMWYREQVARETVEGLGGAARARHMTEAICERLHPDKVTAADTIGMLKRAPFVYDRATHLWRYDAIKALERLERLYASVGPLSQPGSGPR